MINSTKKFILNNKLYLFTLVVWAWFVALLPYTLDDWTWGTEIGMQRLTTWFEGYSGRYLGNLIQIVLTRSTALRIVVMAVFIGSVPLLIEKMTKTRINFVLSLLLMLLMPVSMWKMTIAWTAGFSNYVTSIIAMLIYFLYAFSIFEDTYDKKQNYVLAVGTFVLGLCNTLIVEYITIYHLIVAVCALFYVVVKERKVFIQHVTYLSGCCIGTYVMYSNPVYTKVATGSHHYWSVAEGGIKTQLFDNYFQMVYKYFFSYNFAINLTIVVLGWIIIEKREKNNKLIKGLMTVFSSFVMWSFWAKRGVGSSHLSWMRYFDGGFTLIAGLCLLAVLLISFWSTKYRMTILFLSLSQLCICAQLLLVNPVTERCFFANYILWIVMIGIMIRYIFENGYLPQMAWEKLRSWSLYAITAIAFFYIAVYSIICTADINRRDYLWQQIEAGETSVDLIHLPFESYVNGSMPIEDEKWMGAYKSFYGFPKDIEIINTDRYEP